MSVCQLSALIGCRYPSKTLLLLLSCIWSCNVTICCTLLRIALTDHSNCSNLHSCHTYYSGAATMLLTRMLRLDADQDSVRLLAVEACGPLARLLNKGESVQHVLPIVQKFAQVCWPQLLSRPGITCTEPCLTTRSCYFALLPFELTSYLHKQHDVHSS